MKTGWWKICFDITLDGIGIDFDELSVENKRRIQTLLGQGCVAGEVVEEDRPDEDMQER